MNVCIYSAHNQPRWQKNVNLKYILMHVQALGVFHFWWCQIEIKIVMILYAWSSSQSTLHTCNLSPIAFVFNVYSDRDPESLQRSHTSLTTVQKCTLSNHLGFDERF
jgi:hypothetical protein